MIDASNINKDINLGLLFKRHTHKYRQKYREGDAPTLGVECASGRNKTELHHCMKQGFIIAINTDILKTAKSLINESNKGMPRVDSYTTPAGSGSGSLLCGG
jgi:hypothetical protein